jgi:hypothetical protein
MSILSVVFITAIVIFLVMPQWHIIATDLWSSVLLAGNERRQLPYPWILTLLAPTITSILCVGLAYLMGFNIWLAIGLCIICILMGMLSGLCVLVSKKDADCSVLTVILYFSVIFLLMFVCIEVFSRVGELTINGWI